jgi:hypothetical protein
MGLPGEGGDPYGPSGYEGVDMSANYMDYSSDVCYRGFTEGQGARMVNLWGLYREGKWRGGTGGEGWWEDGGGGRRCVGVWCKGLQMNRMNERGTGNQWVSFRERLIASVISEVIDLACVIEGIDPHGYQMSAASWDVSDPMYRLLVLVLRITLAESGKWNIHFIVIMLL